MASPRGGEASTHYRKGDGQGIASEPLLSRGHSELGELPRDRRLAHEQNEVHPRARARPTQEQVRRGCRGVERGFEPALGSELMHGRPERVVALEIREVVRILASAF